MQRSFMKYIVSAEYLIAAILVAVFYIIVGEFAWYWLPITFLLFDISAAGYWINKTVGAWSYNIAHSLIGPTILAAVVIVNDSRVILFITLIWLFHIFVDRALGFGLKHRTGFKHTHLDTVDKANKKK